MSHLHGCVNWNRKMQITVFMNLCRTFTGAWIETQSIRSRNSGILSHLHGCVNWNTLLKKEYAALNVAPSRVRELKPDYFREQFLIYMSHLHGCVNWNRKDCNVFKVSNCRTFMGAWIETLLRGKYDKNKLSHLHGCVNWNTIRIQKLHKLWGRTFMGAWIETGLTGAVFLIALSHLHGCVNWNCSFVISKGSLSVAPSWVRELKQAHCRILFFLSVAPSWVRELKLNRLSVVTVGRVAPSWVRELKLCNWGHWPCLSGSHLHGCVNWNKERRFCWEMWCCRTFMGAWIETQFGFKNFTSFGVAPSWVRELKHFTAHWKIDEPRRTFMGAWIET